MLTVCVWNDMNTVSFLWISHPIADSFEVSVNGELIYSKLETGEFPDNEEVSEM